MLWEHSGFFASKRPLFAAGQQQAHIVVQAVLGKHFSPVQHGLADVGEWSQRQGGGGETRHAVVAEKLTPPPRFGDAVGGDQQQVAGV